MSNEPFFSPDDEYIYNLIVEYYDNPILYKVQDENGQSIFGIQLPSLLLNSKRFLLATTKFCPEQKKNLKDVPWKFLQIRTLNNQHKYTSLPVITYKQKRNDKFFFPLQVASRNREITTYSTPYDTIDVSLLHVKGIEFEYPNEGTFISALETFQTIISIKP